MRPRSGVPDRRRSAQATASKPASRPPASASRSNAMAYMNVDEIEAALDALATSHPGVSELILLPNRTSEGRQSHALRIGPADAQGADGILFTGGLHAREWVPPDALVNLAADVLEAHARGTGLRYGNLRFSADDIRGVVEKLQLVVFPCVNP